MAQIVGSAGGPAKPPAKPAPKPKATPVSKGVAAIVAPVSHAAQTITHAVAPPPHAAPVRTAPVAQQPPRRASAPPSHTDASSGYDAQRAQAFKKTPAYAKTVGDVFKAQTPQQQVAVLKGLHSYGASDPYTSRAIAQALHSLPLPQRMALQGEADKTHPDLFASVSKGLGALGHIFSPKTVYGSTGRRGNGGLIGSATPFGTGTYGRQLAENVPKDLVNLPAEAFATAGTLGGDVLHHNVAKGISDLTSPFVQLAEHPLKTVVAHPLDTYLMVAGALHGASRPVAGAVRAAAPDSAFGRMLARERPSVSLTGNLTHERPPYSQYPMIQAAQKIAERAKYHRTAEGLKAKSEPLEHKLTALETSRELRMNERVRRANRDQAKARRLESVRPSKVARVTQQTKRALKSGHEAATIKGAEHLALLPDATIRSAKTAAADVRQYINLISSNRGDLLDRPDLLAEHDAKVKSLNKLAKDLESGKIDKQALFKASEAYAKDYKPVQAEAKRFGQFGTRTADMLNRRVLAHYALTHMGAKFEQAPEELSRYENLKQTVMEDKNLSFGQRMAKLRDAYPQGKLLKDGKLLSNDAIRRDMKANGVNHTVAFTSDKPAPDSAFYVSSDRRPLPESARNTYFAYTHGLTDTSHEALLRQHVRMQGIVDAHKAQNRLLEQIAVQKKGGGYWSSYQDAKTEASRFGNRYVPIRLSQAFHPQAALDMALEGVHPATLEEEAQLHGLDLHERLQDSGPGRYGLISKVALERIEQHQSEITPNLGQRAFTSLNNQFRRVALSTSAKHVPGVATEQIIRDIASGVGLSSWITGHRILGRMEKANPAEYAETRTRLTGGQLAGATQMAARHFVADRYRGTSLYRPIKAFESFMEKPGPRQLATAWRAWADFAVGATKHVLEEQHQIADIGKAALVDFSSEHGPFFKALRLQGRMLDEAAHGLYDPAKQRQFRVLTERIRGRWNDLTPHGQMALMYSPFGLWWLNSVKWLARAPIDQPVKTGLFAAATVGTEKERQAHGLDMFMNGALPLYMQGGIPIGGGKTLAQNYYSPFGVANDPLETGASLLEPWMTPAVLASFGLNWHGGPIESPSNPHGKKEANVGERVGVILDSALASFIPLYTKAEQVAGGGTSEYDTSSLVTGIQTKGPNGGPVAGAEKALKPYRSYKAPAASSSSSSSGGWGGSSSSSSGGWGGTRVSSGGWG